MRTPDDQEAADIALARTLQEQERAYMLLAGGQSEDVYPLASNPLAGFGLGGGGQGSASNEVEVEHEDPSVALARALMEEEEREHRARMLAMAGIAPPGAVEEPQEEDPEGPDAVDGMGYEELTALGETVGTVSKGISTSQIGAVCRSVTYAEHCRNREVDAEEQCAVCRFEFQNDDEVGVLRCSHGYHPECIAQWLAINKSCPVCGKEAVGGGTPLASKPSPSKSSPQQPSPGRLCPAV